MLNLSEIKFSVETSELSTALGLVDKLGTAVSNLKTPVKALASDSKELAKAQKDLNAAQADSNKQTKAQAKATEAAAKAAEKAQKATEAQAKGTESATQAMTANERVLEKQRIKLEVLNSGTVKLGSSFVELGQGLTASQASAVANMKIMGGTADQLQLLTKYFRDYAAISGQNPFDASANGLSRLKRETTELNRINTLSAQGFGLTKEQVKLLSRDLIALEQNYANAGKGQDELRAASERLTTEFVQEASARNTLIAASEEMERQLKAEARARAAASGPADSHVTAFNKQNAANMKAAASAANNLERELERAENAVLGLNNQVQVSTSNRLLKFKAQLAASGMAADVAQAKYVRYSKAIQQADAVRAVQTKRTREDELKYLARATSVQLGDIGISLAGGQNPLLVFIQQGDQLRAVLNQVGGDAAEMKMAMSQAFKQIVVGFVDVGKAIGNFVIGSFADAGKALVGFSSRLMYDIPVLGGYLAEAGDKFEEFAKGSSLAARSAGFLGSSLTKLLPILAAGFIAGAVTAVIAFGVALKQVITLENELNKAVTLSGAAMGVTYESTIKNIDSLKSLGYTQKESTVLLTEMAKAGNLSVKSLDDIANAAINLERKAGIPIEETVKKASEFGKEPVEALIKFATESGRVSTAVIYQVAQLVEQGKTSEASAVAIREFGRASAEAATEVEANYGKITRLGLTLKGVWNEAWDAIMGWGSRKPAPDRLKDLEEKLKRNKGFMALDELAELESLQRQVTVASRKGTAANDAYLRSENAISAALAGKALKAKEENLKRVDKLTNEIKETQLDLNKAISRGDAESAKIFQDKIKRLELEKAEASKPKKVAKTTEQKELDAATKAYESFVEKMKVSTTELTAIHEDLNESQMAVVRLLVSDEWSNMSAAQKETAMAYFKTAEAAETAKDAMKQATAAAEQAAQAAWKNDKDMFKDYEDFAKGLRESEQATKEQNSELEFQNSILGKTAEQQKLLNSIRQERLNLELQLSAVDTLRDYDNGVEKEEFRVKIRKDSAKKIAALEKRLIDETNDYYAAGITDAIMVGLTEGGSAGAKSLRDFIVAELKKPITVYINAIVSDLVGLVTGTGGTTSSLIGQAVTNYMSTGSIFGTAASSMGTGLSAAGTSLGYTYGTGAMSQQSIMLAMQDLGYSAATTGTVTGSTSTVAAAEAAASAAESSALAAEASTLAAESSALAAEASTGAAGAAGGAGGTSALAIAGYAALIVAAVYAGSAAYDAGWNQEAVKDNEVYENSIENVNYQVGRAIGMSEKWATILSGSTRMGFMFGRKPGGSGIEATVNNGVVGANNYQNMQGGWFSSNKTIRSDASAEIADPVIDAVEAMKQSTIGFAASLGLSTEAIENYTGSFKLKLKGLSDDEINANFTKELQKMQEQMLANTEGFRELQKSGESVKETLARLHEEAMAFANAAGYSADTMASTIKDGMLGRLSEADLGSALAEQILGSVYNALAQGFADQVTGAITSLIIQPIMTSIMMGGTVSAAVSQASIAAVYNQAKAAMDAFAAILNDPAMQSLFAELGAMSTRLASIISRPVGSIRTFTSSMRASGNAAAEAAKKIADEKFGLQGNLMEMLGMTAELRARELAALHPSNRALKQHIYDLEDASKAYEEVASALETTLDEARDIESTLQDIFDTLKDEIKNLRNEVEDTAKLNQAQAMEYILGLMNSDYTEIDTTELQEAITAVSEGIANTDYRTQADEDVARLMFANTLETLQDLVGNDLTTKSADIILLEDAIELAKEQIDALLGIKENTYTVSTGIAALSEAVANYQVAISNGFAAVSGASSTAPAGVASGGSSGGGYSGGSSGGSANSGAWTAEGYWVKNPDLHAEFTNSNLENSPDFNKDPKLSARDEYLAWHWENFGKDEKRKFAKGGYYPGGLAMVGEEGPELINFSRPGQVYTAGQTSDIIQGGNSAQLESMQAALVQIAVATNKLQRQFAGYRGEDGTSLNVTVQNGELNPVTTISTVIG